MHRIMMKQKENDRDNEKIIEFQRNGIKPMKNGEIIDIKLSNAVEDIKIMNKDSSIFCKTLSKFFV